MKIKVILTATLLTSTALIHAAEWKSAAELGMVMTGGNSETQSTNGKISAARDTEQWTQTGSFEALGSSNTDPVTDVKTTTAEKYAAKLQADRKLDAENFLFGASSYDDDRFSGFDYQATVSAGYGRNIFKNDTHSLKAEIGPGMRFFKLSPVAGVHIPSDDEGIVHMAANYIYHFNEHASFSQNVVIDAGEDVTISESVSALSAQISGKLAMKASVKFKNTSEVPAGIEKTDSETALTLVYSIK